MLRRWLLACVVVVSAWFLPVVLRGDELARPAKETPTPAEIDRLIRQLGNEEFSEREEASRQLKKIGPPAMSALRAALKSKDAEVSRRAADIAAAIENTLEQLVIDYRAFGLPLPPKDAKLVRYGELGRITVVNGEIQPKDYGLGFQLKPATAKQGPTVLAGPVQWQARLAWPADEIKPTPEAVKDLALGDGDKALGLAIQCYDRGWHKLGQHLLERSRNMNAGSPRLQLLQMAWGYWDLQLTQPKIDRAPIAKHFKELIARDKSMDTASNRALLRSLELVLVPSKAKPGSVEALIDDLVDYCPDREKVDGSETEVHYLRIAERGFDAVPALIEHLDDERLTRSNQRGFNNFFGYPQEVRHVVSDLLEGLAGREIDRDWVRRLQGAAVEKTAAKKWWDEARKVGEETYLLKHVLTDAAGEDERARLNAQQFQVIAVKYPKQLPALFRTALDKSLDLESLQTMYKTIAQSKLAAKDKVDLLRDATRHKDSLHYMSAFLALKDVDKKEFNELLLATIEAFPKDVPGPYVICRKVVLARLVMESDDPRLWTAMEKVAKRSVVGLRMALLDRFGDPEETTHRAERLRLVAAFLDDETIRDRTSSDKFAAGDDPRKHVGSDYKKLAVRDFAALELGDLLGVDVPLKEDRTPDEWAKVCDQVRKALERELGQRK